MIYYSRAIKGFNVIFPMLLCLLPVLSFSATITVTNSGNSGAGSLRAAVAAAGNGDTIRFDASLAGDTIRLTSGQIIISSNVVIAGLGVNATIISGNNSSRIFRINPTYEVTIEQLTLARGMAADSGGAIFNSGILLMNFCAVKNSAAANGGALFNNALLSLNECIIRENTAVSGWGGGVFSPAGNLIATSSTFESNTASTGGGGIAVFGSTSFAQISVTGNSANAGGGIYATAALNLNFGVVSNNSATAGDGGGIFSSGNGKLTTCSIYGNSVTNSNFSGGGLHSSGLLLLTASTVRNNSSAGKAGGIFCASSSSVISCSIYDNTAGTHGGAISNSGTLLSNYSTLSGNTAGQSGGALENSGKTTLNRCTVAFNEAGTNGGGAITSDSLKFKNTIFSNNTASQQGPEIFNNAGKPISLGYNLVKNNAQSGFTPATGDIIGTSVIPVDALLAPLQANGSTLFNHEPLCGSPAIDAGDTTGAPAFDQRGAPRIHGNGIDIGSVESQLDPIEITAVITDASQSGSTDGAIQLLVTGGTAPYDFIWNNGGQLNVLSNLSKGSYSVTVSDFFNCSVEAIYTVGGPNSVENISAAGISVFPNPATDFCLITNASFFKITSVTFFNLDGSAVKSFTFNHSNDEKIRVDLSFLPAGQFLLMIETENGMYSGRLAKAE